MAENESFTVTIMTDWYGSGAVIGHRQTKVSYLKPLSRHWHSVLNFPTNYNFKKVVDKMLNPTSAVFSFSYRLDSEISVI